MERRIGRRIGTLLICMLLLVPVTAQGQAPQPLEAVAQNIGCAYEDILTSDKLVPGESVSDWVAIATGCSGDPVKRNAYLKGLEAYVTEQYAENGGLHRIKATEWHRISLAILALGGDPTAFGKDAINLIADGTYNFQMADSLGLQGLNGWIFALITLDASGYEVPDNARFTREDMIREIIAAQTEDGGFGLSGNSADVDITAMALQALAPYYAEDTEVASAADRALNWLSARQNEHGDFTSWGAATAEGTAQTVIALCSLGIDPRTDERFIKNGNSPVDGLMQYQTENGMFRHTSDSEADMLATEQAALALIALDRLDRGGKRLYDLTDVAVYQGGDDAAPKEGTGPVLWIIVATATAAAAVAVVFVKGKKKHV